MIFKKKFRRVFYVPGNHVPQPTANLTGNRFLFATSRFFQAFRLRNAPKKFNTFSSLHFIAFVLNGFELRFAQDMWIRPNTDDSTKRKFKERIAGLKIILEATDLNDLDTFGSCQKGFSERPIG